jgi:small subunit ribosomal protein S15
MSVDAKKMEKNVAGKADKSILAAKTLFATQTREEVLKAFQRNEKDAGSSEVQVALLTNRIVRLTSHFETHRDDKHSMRGMMKLISQRKKLLAYLKRESPEKYKSVITELGLRK